MFGKIIRFNQIVVMLFLLGVKNLTGEERADIWVIINEYANPNEDIVTRILNNRS